MKKSLAAILLFIALLLTACTGADEQEESTESFFAMDTHITFTAYGKNAQSALSEAKGLVEDLEQRWSVTDTGSEIYAVNHSGGQPVTVSHDTADLITFALEMAERTSGALEPTIYPVLTVWGFTTDENRIPPEDEIRENLLKVGYDRVELTGDKLPTHVIVHADGLATESVVLLEQIRTLDKRRLIRFSGKLDKTTMGRVDHAIIVSFGIKYMEGLL